jgi:hypothetical protein
MLSKAKYAKIIFPIRCTKEFVRLCKFKSNQIYPVKNNESGPKSSAARFLKMAAIEKLTRIGLNEEYLKSII